MFKFSTRLILALFIVLFFTLLYTHNLIPATSFEGDLARDAYDMLKIAKGDFTLLGPKLSFGGIYSSPFYYYLFAPILFLFRFNFESVIYSNAIFFAITLGVFFYNLYPKLKTFKTLLLTLCLGLTPLGIFLARHPGNAFTIMIFLQLLLLFFFVKPKFSLASLVITGFLSGVVVSLHPVTLLIVAPLFWLVYQRAQKKHQLLFYFLAALIPFIPLILFELKHNFIMFTNTFIHQSYKTFVNNENLGGPLQVSANPFKNLFILNQKLQLYLLLGPVFLLILGWVFGFQKPTAKKLLTITTLSFLLIVLTLRFQFAIHYLFPFAFLILFVSLFVIVQTKYYYLLVIYLFILIWQFPKDYYQATNRQLNRFEQVVNKLIDSNFLQNTANLNVLQVRKNEATTPYGFEYRYFLLKNNISTLNEFQYPQSQNLLVLSETNIKPKQISNWEMNQFGKTNWKNVRKTRIENIQVYFISK